MMQCYVLCVYYLFNYVLCVICIHYVFDYVLCVVCIYYVLCVYIMCWLFAYVFDAEGNAMCCTCNWCQIL